MKRFHQEFRIFKGFFGVLALLVFTFSCATIVPPTGGIKDEIPPTLTYSNPLNKSANFKGDRLILGFSEYIQLVDIDKHLIISPPLNEDPDFRIKGRSLVVKLKDTLRSNTTYNFYFGDAIADITERNPLKNLSFAFSTGSFIDSLSLKGRVTDAFTRMPVKDALVMLYRDLADSVPMLQRPMYVSRSGEGGAFILNSLAAGKYRLVALKDGNNDYLYNPATENVAFFDSLVEPLYLEQSIIDTSLKVMSTEGEYALNLFPEPDSTQRLLKGVMTAPHLMTLFFRYPVKELSVIPLNMDSTAQWSMREYSAARDTVYCWLTGVVPDTLKLKIQDEIRLTDTLEIGTTFKIRSNEKGKNQSKADSSLHFVVPVARTRQLEWNMPYIITFPNPLQLMDSSKVLLIRGKETPDTLFPVLQFVDQLHRKVKVNFPWKTAEDYELLFPQGVFKDIYGAINDTVRSKFQLRTKEDYGQFKMNIVLATVKHPVIIQLLGDKNVVLQQHVLDKSGWVDFGFLIPGKYGLKAIYDQNANGKWDSGRFLQYKQPERIDIHPKIFEVRGNWDLEEEWQM
ncbi:MAG: Ig-like domain-containing protein [Bacteroidales bacterium]|nr:Ig-like domain-containing protein [Bacteroidales bacterium]